MRCHKVSIHDLAPMDRPPYPADGIAQAKAAHS
jgi:hypothetical protein